MYIVTHVKQQVSRLWSRVSDFTREVNNELIRARISCFIKQHDQLKKLNLNQSTLFQKDDLNASYYRVYDVLLNFNSQGVLLLSNVPRSRGCFVSPVHIKKAFLVAYQGDWIKKKKNFMSFELFHTCLSLSRTTTRWLLDASSH